MDFEDPWGSYALDALGLMDHLGIEAFHVLGCCIGCSHALKLIELAPHRVLSCVLEQPVGVIPANADLVRAAWKPWAHPLVSHGRFEPAALERYCGAMFAGDFVLSVDREFVKQCQTPLLVLPGIDKPHPTEIGREIGGLAPHATVLEPWKEPSSIVPGTVAHIRRFFAQHSGPVAS